MELARSLRRGDLPTVVTAEGRATKVIPVATDGGGNAFLMAADLGTIWRWDRETGTLARVARDLAEFLHLVAEDWDHDLADDRDWRYLV